MCTAQHGRMHKLHSLPAPVHWPPTWVGDDVEHGAGGVAHQRVARKRAAMVAWHHHCRNVLLQQNRADGQAACVQRARREGWKAGKKRGARRAHSAVLRGWAGRLYWTAKSQNQQQASLENQPSAVTCHPLATVNQATQLARKRLGQGHHVGLHAVVLVAPQLAGAAQPNLARGRSGRHKRYDDAAAAAAAVAAATAMAAAAHKRQRELHKGRGESLPARKSSTPTSPLLASPALRQTQATRPPRHTGGAGPQ